MVGRGWGLHRPVRPEPHGEVALTLTNVWDPPGSLRYSCEQMRRIVESVRSCGGNTQPAGWVSCCWQTHSVRFCMSQSLRRWQIWTEGW